MSDLSYSVEFYIRRANGSFLVDARLTSQTSEAGTTLASGCNAPLDIISLRSQNLDIDTYGSALTRQIFADEKLREAWARASASAEGRGVLLHVRLRFEPEDHEIHALVWEVLRDPITGIPLAMSERFILSRHLESNSIRAVSAVRRPEMAVAVAIANPQQLDRHGFTPIHVSSEIAHVRVALGSAKVTLIGNYEGAVHRAVTLDAILDAVRSGSSVLYLVCHGCTIDGQPYLWLEQPSGSTEPYRPLPGRELWNALSQLSRPPMLVILAACQGAGNGDDMLSAIGPGLIQAGVPAVIAWRGNAPLQITSLLFPTFFRELTRDGRIDRAIAAARMATSSHMDWWRAVLWLNTQSGCLWTEPGRDAYLSPSGPQPVSYQASSDTAPINPFEYGSPVPPERFYGRRRQRITVRGKIGGISMNSVSIVGLRRSGKSSLLRYIAGRMDEFCHPDLKPMIISLDLQDRRFQAPAGLIEGLRRGVYEALGTILWPTSEQLTDWEFVDGLKRLRNSDYRLIVMLDEFEQIGQHLEAFQDWGSDWRAKSSAGLLGMIIASQRSIDDIYKTVGLTSPFGNIFTLTYLGGLSLLEVEQLVTEGFMSTGRVLSPRYLQIIDELAGGLPYFVQMAAALLWEYQDEETVRDIFLQEAEPRFDELWRGLSNPERNAVCQAAGVLRGDPAPGVLRSLQRLGIFRDDNRLFSSLLAAYIRENFGQ